MYPGILDWTNPSDAALDYDGDRLSNLEEFRIGTDITKTDTDGDAFRGYGNDYQESIVYGTDPLDYDTDDGGAGDGLELYYGGARGA